MARIIGNHTEKSTMNPSKTTRETQNGIDARGWQAPRLLALDGKLDDVANSFIGPRSDFVTLSSLS